MTPPCPYCEDMKQQALCALRIALEAITDRSTRTPDELMAFVNDQIETLKLERVYRDS